MFKNLEISSAKPSLTMVRCDTFLKLLLVLSVTLQLKKVQAAPMIDDDIIMNLEMSMRNRESVNSAKHQEKHVFSHQHYLNPEDILEKYLSNLPRGFELEDDQNTSEDKLVEELKENKAMLEYIVESAEKHMNQHKSNTSPSRSLSKKQKQVFKKDKNLKRIEKKSWKIPMKTLALYTENSHQGQNMMDELTEAFNAFKDSGK